MTTGASERAPSFPLTLRPGEPFEAFTPNKPHRMSEKAYRDLYDSKPLVVTAEPTGDPKKSRVRLVTAGLVSAQEVARTYHRDGYTVTVEPESSSH